MSRSRVAPTVPGQTGGGASANPAEVRGAGWTAFLMQAFPPDGDSRFFASDCFGLLRIGPDWIGPVRFGSPSWADESGQANGDGNGVAEFWRSGVLRGSPPGE